MPSNDELRAITTKYRERFSAGDREGWLELFADDATLEDPVGTDVRKGRDQIAEFYDFSRTLSDSVTLESAGPACVAMGNEVAFPMTVVTSFGDSKMALDVIDVMTFDDDGRIKTMRAFWDMSEMRPYEG